MRYLTFFILTILASSAASKQHIATPYSERVYVTQTTKSTLR